MACGYAVYTYHHDVVNSEDMHQPWKPCKEHAPFEKAVDDAANSRRHVPHDADDESDHGASHRKRNRFFCW